MITEKITVQNQLGLHARASMELVKVADRFSSKILVRFKNRELNAKSIMGVLVLGAKLNDVLEFCIQGEDEKAAWAAIKHLIDDKFHEEK